ncbi:MAG: hypothetical protein ACKPKO_21335, partial [Candidatus Fonsibacter sp.]
MIWVAKLVVVIELQGKTDLMWAQSTSYRDEILDKICNKYFGCTDPTDRDVRTDQQRAAVASFRKMTVSRAKQAGSYRDVARDIAATHAANMLSEEALSRVRATSMGPRQRPRSPSRPRVVLR